MKVTVKKSSDRTQRLVEFMMSDGKEFSYLMPTELAKVLELRTQNMSFGIRCDDRLIAAFRHEGDRNICLDELQDRFSDSTWEKVDA